MFLAFLLNTLLGGYLILGIGLTILLIKVIGEEAGGVGLIIALGLYVILKQY
ncbi:hypothetical protein JW906_16365 [bacterium]|nr:hypothetical protein [bacterium]